jgi:hypothetical protein
MSRLLDMLRTSAIADKAKALLTLELLEGKAVGIGDHSTGDFYENAEEALRMLVDADDRYFTQQQQPSEVTEPKKDTKQQLNG